MTDNWVRITIGLQGIIVNGDSMMCPLKFEKLFIKCAGETDKQKRKQDLKKGKEKHNVLEGTRYEFSIKRNNISKTLRERWMSLNTMLANSCGKNNKSQFQDIANNKT